MNYTLEITALPLEFEYKILHGTEEKRLGKNLFIVAL